MPKDNIIDNNFENIKQKAEEFYGSIGKVKCPYFNQEISFNSKGILHAKFKNKYNARKRSDSFMRLKNIHFAPEILKISRTLQEKESKHIFVEIKTNNRKEKILKRCDYFGFIAIIKDRGFEKRFKIIVRQIEGGEKHFWSIIPFWKSNKELKFHSGNLEED